MRLSNDVKDVSTLSNLEIISPRPLGIKSMHVHNCLLFSFQHVFHCVVIQVGCLSLLMQILLITKAYISIF